MVVSLVGTAVFKTVEPYGKHAVGGFDSHALPPFFHPGRLPSLTNSPPRPFLGFTTLQDPIDGDQNLSAAIGPFNFRDHELGLSAQLGFRRIHS